MSIITKLHFVIESAELHSSSIINEKDYKYLSVSQHISVIQVTLHKNSWFKNLNLMVKLGFIYLILHSMNYKSFRKLNSNLLGISLKLFHSPLWSTYHDRFENVASQALVAGNSGHQTLQILSESVRRWLGPCPFNFRMANWAISDIIRFGCHPMIHWH